MATKSLFEWLNLGSRSRALQTNKQTKKPNFCFWRLRAAADLHQTLHEERGCPYHFCTPLIFSIRPVVSELGDSENFGGNAPSRYFTDKFNSFCWPIAHINPTDFIDIGQRFDLAGWKSWKFWHFFALLGPETPKYLRMNVKFGTALISSSSMNRVAAAGRKTSYNCLLSNCNNGGWPTGD